MPDLNDKRLARPEGTAIAFQVSGIAADLLEAPDPAARIGTQALTGEILDTYREEKGFILARCRRDNYVGWVQPHLLSERIYPPTHKVVVRRTLGFSRPDLKSPVRAGVCFGSRLAATGAKQGPWIEFESVGWVYDRHVAALESIEADPAGVAERFLEMPYLWGGRGAQGIDCSGLVQQAFEACGVLLPRDSDMQAAWAGEEVTGWQVPGTLQRGDLVFWEGHVGILTRPDELLHANVFHMAVAREPLATAISRIRPVAGEVTAVRRINIEATRGVRPDWLRPD